MDTLNFSLAVTVMARIVQGDITANIANYIEITIPSCYLDGCSANRQIGQEHFIQENLHSLYLPAIFNKKIF